MHEKGDRGGGKNLFSDFGVREATGEGSESDVSLEKAEGW